MPIPACIATWPFGRAAVEAALPLLLQGKPALDCAIAAAQVAEDDPRVNSVGYGGLPDALGNVTLDACVMDGRTLNCGAVAAVSNIRNVAALARRVMETTPHLMLAGEGARQFGVQQGFELQCLNTEASLADWDKRRSKQAAMSASAFGEGDVPPQGHNSSGAWEPVLYSHDTISVLALDQQASLGGVCTTSGLANKVPGRVGDSPIIGSGLYVDDTAGAAGGTGVGEEIMRIGGSLLIVEAMRAGRSPQEACELAVRRVNEVAQRRNVTPARVAFVALDTQGRYGAAATPQTNFEYAIIENGKVEMRQAR